MNTLRLFGGTAHPGSARGLSSLTHAPAFGGPSPDGVADNVSFRDVLFQAVAAVDGAQKAADEAGRRLAAGEAVELHEVMMAAEKATLTLEIAVAIQRKCIEAYQELSRMQI